MVWRKGPLHLHCLHLPAGDYTTLERFDISRALVFIPEPINIYKRNKVRHGMRSRFKKSTDTERKASRKTRFLGYAGVF